MGRGIGEFEQLLLLALLRLDDESAFGARVRTEIEQRTGRTISPGAVYTALDRLEQRGLVGSRLGEPSPERGGKRKRHYWLRPAGVAEARAVHEALTRMTRGLKPKLESS